MTWPRASLYVGLAAVLGTYYVATTPPRPAPEARPAPGRAGLDVIDLVIESGGRRVRVTREDGRWQTIEPAGSRVSSDLVAALLSAVLDTAAETVGPPGGSLSDFGLDTPSARLTFRRRDRPPVTLALGALNPTGTAVYARLEGAADTVLVGLNARYYLDLVLEAAVARQ